MGGYQLKVGGVVVGSWAKGSIMGVPNRNNAGNGVQARLNRATLAAAASSGNAVASQLMRYPISARQARMPMNSRLQRVAGPQHIASLGRTIARNTYGNNKVNRPRNRNRQRKNGKMKNDLINRIDHHLSCSLFPSKFLERKNQKQTTDNADNKTDETKVIPESDAAKDVNATDTDTNANG